MGRIPSRRVRRAVMLATTYLVLAAQAMTLGHLLLVPHEVCAAHGEAIHSRPGKAHVRDQGESDTHRLGWAATQGHDDGDQHCLVRATTRERFLLQPLADFAVALCLVSVTSPLVAESAPAHGVSVLRLAPKNSPPLV